MGRITMEQMTQKLIVSDCLVSNTWSEISSRFLYLKTENWRNQQSMKWNFADPLYATQELITGIACMIHVYLRIGLACDHSWASDLE